jgi:phosphatidylserine decarboxylase
VLSYLSSALFWPAVAVGVALVSFSLWFFRDPRRKPPADPTGLTVVAPADGKVLEVSTSDRDDFLGGPACRVSIFLSPLDVHVNRSPVPGTVEHVRYIPGEYLVAWHPKSSERNERSEIGVRHPSGHRVLFKQIAGAVARRVVFHVSEGDRLGLGQRFGIVKFGSRMDVLMPPAAVILVEKGQRVVAGETVIAQLPGVGHRV